MLISTETKDKAEKLGFYLEHLCGEMAQNRWDLESISESLSLYKVDDPIPILSWVRPIYRKNWQLLCASLSVSDDSLVDQDVALQHLLTRLAKKIDSPSDENQPVAIVPLKKYRQANQRLLHQVRDKYAQCADCYELEDWFDVTNPMYIKTLKLRPKRSSIEDENDMKKTLYVARRQLFTHFKLRSKRFQFSELVGGYR